MLSTLIRFIKLCRRKGFLFALGYSRDKFRAGLKGSYRLPNTPDANLRIWSNHDWSMLGEEWSTTSEWKESVIEHVLKPNVSVGSRILEIGPGAGRWTEQLLQMAKYLAVVDITPECIEICKERFKNFMHVDYFVTDGRDLSFIPANSIDRIWSWDVFVHIQSEDVGNYIRQFADILVPGGRGIIHHSKTGTSNFGAWRSNMTARKMVDLCRQYGLEILQQIDSWDNGHTRLWPELPENVVGPDVITIFAKPG